MMCEKKIPKSVIERLPTYLHYLKIVSITVFMLIKNHNALLYQIKYQTIIQNILLILKCVMIK